MKKEFVKIFESIIKLIWLIFTIIIVMIYHDNILELFTNIQKIKISEVEVEFKENNEKKNLVDSSSDTTYKYISPNQQRAILTRANNLSETLKKTRILWIDDNPSNNYSIKKIFEKFGVIFDIASSSNDAEIFLDDTSNKYAVIISDNCRNDSNDVPGILFAEDLHHDYSKQNLYFDKSDIPVIIYSGHFSSVDRLLPIGVFATTNRADYLIQYTFDAIEHGGMPNSINVIRFLYSKDSLRKICGQCSM